MAIGGQTPGRCPDALTARPRAVPRCLDALPRALGPGPWAKGPAPGAGGGGGAQRGAALQVSPEMPLGYAMASRWLIEESSPPAAAASVSLSSAIFRPQA